MRIYSLAKVLSTPIILAAMGGAYYQYSNGDDIGAWIIFPLAILVVLFISHGQIDYWYHKKYPIPLDEEIIRWLKRYSSFYNNLKPSDKEKYEYRMSLYLEGRQFNSVGSEQKELPEDIKAIVATNAIQINFQKEDILIGDFDRIFVYKHPFPTPRHQFLHSVETQVEDGVIIYSLEHLIPGITNPEVYYNIGMHAYVEAFTKAYPNANFPWNLNADWSDVEAISGLKEDFILKTLGFNSADMFVLLGTCYFTYPKQFEARLPELKKEMDKLFGPDSK